MNNNSNPQYRMATFAALVGLFSYGFMRLAEAGANGGWTNYSLLPFYLSMATAALVLAEHFLLKRFEIISFAVVFTINTAMTFGSYFTGEWSYYYLAALGMTGISCLYGKLRQVIIYQAVNMVVNVLIFNFLLSDMSPEFRRQMSTSFGLYIYGSVFLIILFYRAYKREGAAQSGLQAFSLLLGSTPNLMVIVDDMRKVRYISTPLAKFAGMDEISALGRPLVDLFKTESLKLMFADILDAENFYSATREIMVNDEPRYFKIIADKLSASDAGMFIEITDMTEIVLASIKADEARKEAEVANNSKSRFLTTMSHEIRTPMNAIIGISEIQLSREEVSGDTAQAFKQIHASGHGLLSIINDILDLSKIETGKLEIVSEEYDTASLINDAVQLNIVRVGSKPIEFSLDVMETLPAKLIGDEMHLKQILNNVLSNAFKYTDAGTVKLSVSHQSAEGGIELIFKVADTGQGMKPEDMARLFDAYSRFNTSANRYREGTGLGMNITQRLVEMMNGRIEVESEYGKGSTFTVTVLQQQSPDKAVIGVDHAERLRNFTFTIDREAERIHIKRDYMPYGRVLVVDDVETNLYVARGLLAPYGLKIETAKSGFDAIDMIANEPEYDIVFMDHMMPKMDGIETTRRLREGGYKGTIIALTANAIAGNDKFFKEKGFDDFISKPIDMRHMNAALNQFVRDKQSPDIIADAGARAPETAPHQSSVDNGLLAIFKRDARKAIATLTETARSGDLKLFTITAHAMKSAALSIGEVEVSKLAAELERAGTMGDSAFIEQHTAKLTGALTRIIGEAEHGLVGTVQEDTKFLREKLEQVRAACDDYDGGEARTLLKALRERAWNAETVAALDEIADMVLCSDFDEASALAAKLCEK